jgi:dihydrodipicolinate synthase/N-acetylneuraminate lyase
VRHTPPAAVARRPHHIRKEGAEIDVEIESPSDELKAFEAADDGDQIGDGARDLHRRILIVARAVFNAAILPAMTSAIELRGVPVGSTRHPAPPSPPPVRAAVADALKRADLAPLR